MISIRKGTIIAGKYRIEEPLARGGMGSIWVARHIQLDVLVAVKFIDPDFATTAEGRGRFEREAKSAAMLHSPHVVQIHDYGVEYETPYIAMELLQGEDLSTRLKREGRLTMDEAAKIALHVSKALRRAHEAGIVHRDLKPSNIFIVHGGDEDEELIKVLDFGVAKIVSLGTATDDETKRGSLIGSPRYMSPEQARRNRDIDHRSDLWSLGVILFRAITGQLPFPGDEIGDVIVKICSDPVPLASQINSDIGPDVDHFFEKALAREPEDRFQSARELAGEFAVLAGALPSASRFTWPLPGDGMRISWLPSIATESNPMSSAAALVTPHSSPTPRSASLMKAGSTPHPVAVSMTMPSVEPTGAPPASLPMHSLEPASETIPIPLNSLSAITVPPMTPVTLTETKHLRDNAKGVEKSGGIEPPFLKRRSSPPSSDRTRLVRERSQREERESAEDDAPLPHEEEGRAPVDSGRGRPTPPTLIQAPVEDARRSSPAISEVVYKSSPPTRDVAHAGAPSSDRPIRKSNPSSDRSAYVGSPSSDRAYLGPPSSDRNAYRGSPSSDKFVARGVASSDRMKRGGSPSGEIDADDMPSHKASGTLTGSNGTVDIPTGRYHIRSRRTLAPWVAVAGGLVIVGGAIAIVRLSLTSGGPAPAASPIEIPLPPLVRDTSNPPSTTTARSTRTSGPASSPSSGATAGISASPSSTLRPSKNPFDKPDGGSKTGPSGDKPNEGASKSWPR